MDPSAPSAAAATVPAMALNIAPILAQDPLALPGLLGQSPLHSSGPELDESERGVCLWRPWLCSTSDLSRQMDLATDGATSVKVTKADSKFYHPIRLFWPKSRSFDYLYSYGEILLQNFPVQATINLYEDSDSEEEEEQEEEKEDNKVE
ncbi:protein ripply1 isoform 1-T4 [Rhynchonycteris naso]